MLKLQNSILARVRGLALSASMALVASASHATVTTYTSASAFAAAVTIQNQAGFEGLNPGRSYAPFTQGGVTFTALGQDFYITTPGQALTNNPNTFPTAALSADGDENFGIQLASGASFTAFGLDYATNAYGPPVLSLYSLGGVFLQDVTVTIAPNTVGFFGFVSTTEIGSVRTKVDRGYIADTAIDNVRIGTPTSAAGAVPEPATWGMMLIGFTVIGAAARLAAAWPPGSYDRSRSIGGLASASPGY